MKKLFSIGLTFIFVGFVNIFGQSSGIGLGVILGEPTGISSKLWIDERNAFDLGLGYSFIPSHNKLSLHADYLYHLHKVKISEHEFPIYYGFGARLRFAEGKSGSLGARGVIGILWYSYDLPLDAFIEIVPVFQLLPKTSLLFDAGIGVRYFFD